MTSSATPAPPIVTRFSALALGSVVVFVLTGGARALWEVDAVSQLWSTSYGRLLVLKTVLLIVLVALGYRNRRGLARFSEIHRRGLIELGVMAVLIGAVTVLTNVPPANSPGYAATGVAPPPAGGPATVDLEGGGQLSLWPGTAGRNLVAVRTTGHPAHVRVTVRSADGTTSTGGAGAVWQRLRRRARPTSAPDRRSWRCSGGGSTTHRHAPHRAAEHHADSAADSHPGGRGRRGAGRQPGGGHAASRKPRRPA